MNKLDTGFVVEIERMVFGGDGMARLADGRAVFVPFTLPGEQVRIRLVEEKKKFARAALVEVLRPDPERIKPRCVHFGTCGGCQYQHMTYERQLSTKQAVFTEQIQRIAGLQDPPVRQIHPSPETWNYRNTVHFHLSPAGQPGYHAAGSHDVVEISECHLPMAGIGAIWPQLDFEPGSEIQRVEITEGMDEEILLTLSGSDEPPEMELDLPISVVQQTVDGDLILAGSGYVLMQVNQTVFSVSAGSFFQVNNGLAAEMVSELLARLDVKGKRVIDVYCGVGLFSAFLAPLAAEVIGIEQSPSACQDFAVNLDHFDNVSLYEGDAADILPDLQVNADVMVVDPPRSGLDRRVVDAILQQKPAQLAYISCDPPTLARDLKRLLAGGYHLQEIVPFDLFPQTGHVESISFLTLPVK